MMKTETILTLFDNPKNRKKLLSMNKIEVMADDEDSGEDGQEFWDNLEDFLKWGKKYKLTIEEIA